MPQIKSAKKRVLIAERNNKRNTTVKSEVRTAIKKAILAIEEKQGEDAIKASLNKVNSLIDKAILKGILHKKTGSRYKSRLALRAQKA